MVHRLVPTLHRPALWLTIGSAWLVCSPAWGQDKVFVPPPRLNTQLYSLPIDAEATLWANDAGTAPSGHAGVRLVTQYMKNPLVFNLFDLYDVDVVSDVVDVNVLAAYTWSRVRFGVDLPIHARVLGEQVEPQSGLGDLALEAKGAILDREGGDAPVGAAALVRLTVPSATTTTSVSTEGVTFALEGIVDRRIGPVLVTGNLGHRFVPQAALGPYTWGSASYGRLGAGWFVTEAAGVSLDLGASIVWSIDGSEPTGHPAEGILGAFGRVNDQFVVRGGAGTGLSGGVGAPDLRVVASFGWEPVEVRDQDGDGIVDKADACPERPEDIDGFRDTDGCPDPTQRVEVRVRNHLGELVPGAGLSLQTEDGRKEGGSELVLQMHAGTYDVLGYAERYDESNVSFTVIEGKDTIVEVDLEPLFGEVRAVVRDQDGRYLTGVLEVDGESPVRVSNGVGRVEAMTGTRAAVVRVDGYKTVTVPVEVRAGQRSQVDVVLEAVRAKVTADKIEILEKVFFDTGRATIRPESFALLDDVAAILIEYPDITRVRIEGHTDSQGSSKVNRRLSTERAESVRVYLVNRGVDGARLEAIGYGPDRPLDPARTPAAYDMNRRVEFVIVERAAAE